MNQNIEDVLVWAAIYMYAAASAFLLTGFVFSKPRPLKWAGNLLYPALAAQTIIFVHRWVRTGYFPANGELENAITGGWFAIAFTVYLLVKNRAVSGVALFTVPATLLMLGYGAMKAPDPLPLMASMKSSWLWVHVLFAQVAYGAYAIASGFGVVYLLKERSHGREDDSKFYDRFPRLEVLDESMFKFVVYGFVSEAIMICAGIIWAKDLWGSYWTWDPVEVWTLVSWLLYGLAIHLRVTLGWRGRAMAWLMVVLLSTVIITYWGVDIVMQSTRHVLGVK